MSRLRSRNGASAEQDFSGRIAVVTGAGSGIGRSTALALGRLGASIYVVDLDGERAAAVASEVEAAGGSATAHTVDVTDATAVEGLADDVFAQHRRVDILHNNAGIGVGGPVEQTTLEDWQQVIDVNVMGVIHGIHAFVPRMLTQGRPAHIVNTASLAGLVAVPQLVPYATSKHAIVGLSESLNAELSSRGIHVTALCPGIIDTPIVAAARMRGDTAERRSEIQRFYRRFGASPDDVAVAVVDAIRHRQLIRTVPRSHAALAWAARRISPRAGQLVARGTARITGTGG